MVSKSDFQKDVETGARESGSMVLCFNELISKNVTPGSNCNLDLLFEKAKRFHGENYMEILEKNEVITKIDGFYQLKEGPYMGYGGGQFNSGANIIFYNGSETPQNKSAFYHELAHAFQKSEGLFYTGDIEKYRKIFLEKDYPRTCEKKEIVLASLGDVFGYNAYLREVHSEVFASACMVMRGKGKIGEYLNKWRSLYSGYNQSIEAKFDAEKEYPSAKYYNALSVKKALVKDYTQKDLREKYMQEGGEINFILLAKDLEKVVVENTLSYEEFKDNLKKDPIKEKYGEALKYTMGTMYDSFQKLLAPNEYRNEEISKYKISKIEKNKHEGLNDEYKALHALSSNILNKRFLKENSGKFKTLVDTYKEKQSSMGDIEKERLGNEIDVLDMELRVKEIEIRSNRHKNRNNPAYAKLSNFSEKGVEAEDAILELWEAKKHDPHREMITKDLDEYIGYKFNHIETLKGRLTDKQNKEMSENINSIEKVSAPLKINKERD